MRVSFEILFSGLILFGFLLRFENYSSQITHKEQVLSASHITDTILVALPTGERKMSRARNFGALDAVHGPGKGSHSNIEPLLPSHGLDTLYARIDSLRRAAHVPAAQVAVILPDTTVFWNFGMANASEHITDSTMFRVGSISKTFAGLAMLMLVERGMVRLDDPLAELAPELHIRNPWRVTHPVRLSHLLEAGAGFVGFHPPSPGPTETDISHFLETLPFRLDVQWRPGEYNSYHNLGPVITAYLIEKITGQQYEDFVQKNLFNALGMDNASFFASPTVMQRLAWPPRLNGEAGVGIISDTLVYEHIGGYWPSGGLSTSARELATMLRMLLNRGTFNGQQLLAPESVQRFETPTSTLAARKLGIPLGHGINNWTSRYRGVRYHGHGGRTSGGATGFSGYANYYAYAPETGTGFVFLSTMDPAAEQLHYPVMNAVLSHLHPDETSPAIPATAEETGDVAGCYVLANPDYLSAPLLRWHISIRNGQVWMDDRWRLERTTLPGVYRLPIDTGFGERVMFGSDQRVWPGMINVSIAAIEEAPFLSADRKRDIFYNNAARFLRLSEQEIARHHAIATEADGNQ